MPLVLNLINSAKETRIVKDSKKRKLDFRLKLCEIYPNKTGPNKKPIKPIPDTNEIPIEAFTPGVLPATRNNSGMITERPRPTIPKPNRVILKTLTRMQAYPTLAIILPKKIIFREPISALILSAKNRPTVIITEKNTKP